MNQPTHSLSQNKCPSGYSFGAICVSRAKQSSGRIEYSLELAEWLRYTKAFFEPIDIRSQFATEEDFNLLIDEFLSGEIEATELYERFLKELTEDGFSTQEAQAIITGLIEESSSELRDSVEKLIAEDVKPSTFMRDVAVTLIFLYLMANILGSGRKDVSRNLIANGLRKQFYEGIDSATGKPFGLLYLGRDIQQGRVSKGQLINRLGMYTRSAKAEFWRGVSEKQLGLGKTLAARVLGVAEHCRDCPKLAALGFRPIGEIPPPSEGCECLSNCKCRMVYR